MNKKHVVRVISGQFRFVVYLLLILSMLAMPVAPAFAQALPTGNTPNGISSQSATLDDFVTHSGSTTLSLVEQAKVNSGGTNSGSVRLPEAPSQNVQLKVKLLLTMEQKAKQKGRYTRKSQSRFPECWWFCAQTVHHPGYMDWSCFGKASIPCSYMKDWRAKSLCYIAAGGFCYHDPWDECIRWKRLCGSGIQGAKKQ